MTLAMAAVGDLGVAARAGALPGLHRGHVRGRHRRRATDGGRDRPARGWRWVFYVNLPIGLAALAGLRVDVCRLRAPRPAAPRARRPGRGPARRRDGRLHADLRLGRPRYRLGVARDPGAGRDSLAPLRSRWSLRERRAADPIVPFELLRTRTVAIACAALFLTTAALFAVNVFVPLYLQTTTGATPTQAGLLLVPMMLGITVSTNLAGRGISRHRPLQAVPGRRRGADDRRADRAGRRRRAARLGSRSGSAWPPSASASAWSARC